MNKLIPFLLLTLALIFKGSFAHATLVKRDDTFGKYKVFPSKIREEADLIVYITTTKNEAFHNESIWYFDSMGKISVQYVPRDKADLIVYFTKIKSDAGWVKDNALKGKLN